MKVGKSLSQLAAEIERQQGARRDYIVGGNALKMAAVDILEGGDGSKVQRVEPRLVLVNGGESVYPLRDLAHRQLGERLGIPAKYYDRMLADAPGLLVTNANHWFRDQSERRLVRTLDGHVRAFLSDKYQRIDNAHVAEVVLPVLMESSRQLEVVSCEVTERRLYIKAIDHSIKAEVKGTRRVGDVVEAGIMITNSEVGMGAVSVTPFLMFLACLNGMVLNKQGMHARHVGTRLDVDDDIAALLADDTRKAIDRSQLLKVRDTVRALLDPQVHQGRIDRMSEQAGQKITAANPAASIEVLANDFQLGEGERGSVLRHLIEGGDLSRFGLMNAVTRTAEDAPNYDRATELEQLGGRIFDLPANDWRRIAEAA